MALTEIDALGERRYVSQYAVEPLSVITRRGGVPTDADANSVTVGMTSTDDTVVVFAPRALTRSDLGTYEGELSSEETATPGLWKLTFAWAFDGIPQTFVAVVEVGASSPLYDALLPGYRLVIESVWERFSDLFDSPDGGPHIQVYFQARYTRGRMAALLRIALGKLNTASQPFTTYTLEGPPSGKVFPFNEWGALLEQSLYIETIKHLIRSYTEQPEAAAVAVARLDRRDYTSRWREVLRDEQDEFTRQLENFKIAHMGLGRPRVLVAGGAYGNYGPTRLPGSAAARPRYHLRFFG